MHAGGDGCRGALCAEHGADGQASGERLGNGDDVRLRVEVLEAEPLAGASEAALDLVGDEEGAGGVAELAGGLEELGGDGVDAALALDGLDEDGADVGSGAGAEFGAEVFDVVEADEVDVGHDGREGGAVGKLLGGGDRAHGAAVEAVLEGKEAGAECAAVGVGRHGMGAGELERGLPGLGAAVAEEDAVEAADLGEAEGKLGGALVEEEVRGMEELARLGDEGLLDDGVSVAEGRDADAAEQVEEVAALFVGEIDAVA